MDYAISLAKRFVASPFNTPKRRKQKEMDHSSELSLLGLDSMLRVLSFVDGESMYEVGCVNKESVCQMTNILALMSLYHTLVIGSPVLLIFSL